MGRGITSSNSSDRGGATAASRESSRNICSPKETCWRWKAGRNNTPEVSKQALESLYLKYNRRGYVHPDPLEFLYDHDRAADREIVGMMASSLAYGKVEQILVSVRKVLDVMGDSPSAYLLGTRLGGLGGGLKGFKHRFTTGDDVSRMMAGMKRAIERHGSLNACFLNHLCEDDATVVNAACGFSEEIRGRPGSCEFLMPDVKKGSACKRLNLFLRWMVRQDEVDPGGWNGVPASMLVVPLDTHMFKAGRLLGFTDRKAADMKAALEITRGFAAISPEDPVRYDFALTRQPIRSDASMEEVVLALTKSNASPGGRVTYSPK